MHANCKLTAEIVDEICDFLKRGHFKRSACALVGIHRDTLDGWEQRGRELRQLRDNPPLRDDYVTVVAHRKARSAWNQKLRDGKLFLRLIDEIELAWDFGEGWLVEQVLSAAAGAPVATGKPQRWQAYMTILERSRRERWNRTASIEHSTPGGKPFPVTVDMSKLSNEELDVLQTMLEKARPAES